MVGAEIADDFTNFPPLPGAEPTADNMPPPHRPTPYDNFGEKLLAMLAGVWDAIIRTRNVIVYLLIIIVSFLLWPIGAFLIICLICWILRRR